MLLDEDLTTNSYISKIKRATPTLTNLLEQPITHIIKNNIFRSEIQEIEGENGKFYRIPYENTTILIDASVLSIAGGLTFGVRGAFVGAVIGISYAISSMFKSISNYGNPKH